MDTERFIEEAIREDIGQGDHSSLSCIPPGKYATAKIVVKESGILAGLELAERIFTKINPELVVASDAKDGDSVKNLDMVMTVKGSARSILQAERLVLNFMQRMSGIATLTHQFVQAIKPYPCKILDTRKTTPLFRYFEKWAVRIGGGENHRMGLYDMIMLKDNHIAFAGGIEHAIRAANEYLKDNDLQLEIEIETASMEDVEEVLRIGHVNRIMLDNFTPGKMEEAVKLINGKFLTEASGGITLDNVHKYAVTGVDYISVGALTHSAKSLDLSMQAI